MKYLILLSLFLAACSAGTNGGEEMTIAVFETNHGTFKVELFTEQAPITTGNFIKLANEGYYDGTVFHRVMADFMIQGGDPNGDGTGGPGYSIEDEFFEGSSNLRGTISMANRGPNTGGSQFFINVVDNTYLDYDKPPATSKHPVFGKVVEGMDVVDEISNVDTNPASNRPLEEVKLISVKIEQ